MLPLLPNEIILDVLELTANSSKEAALKLCLLSSSIGRAIRPILYRKVVLVNDRQVMAFTWTLRNSFNFRCTRTLWILNTKGWIKFYMGMELVATKCENLEDLACSANWLMGRPYQIQGHGNTGFTYLKRLCVIAPGTLPILQALSSPITHLHLIEPSREGMKSILLDRAPSLHSLVSLCLESFSPSRTLGFSPAEVSVLLRVLPSITMITIKLDVSYCLPDEVKQFVSGFQALTAKDPRLSVKLNTMRADSTRRNATNTKGHQVLHAVETSNEWT